MGSKLFPAVVGLFALLIFVGIAFVPSSSASPGHVAWHQKSSGLTTESIASARAAGMPSSLVTMAPQSSLKLLSRATEIGPHALQSNIKLTIGLKLRNGAGLKSFLQQVQNPHSAVYHQWLTPKEFTAHYGPSQTDVARVAQFLKAHGITVTDVSPNRILIHTQATTGVYEHALGIRINDYKLDGRSFYSTMDSPKLPRALAPLVYEILGLNHGAQLRPMHHKANVGPSVRTVWHSAAPPPATTGYYLNQLQFAKAYDWPSLTDASNGSGSTIAILSYASSGLLMSDLHGYWTGFGLPDHDVTVVNVDGSPSTGAENETTLDLEYSGAMAPGADIILYEGGGTPNFQVFADTANKMVNDNIADVASQSWGGCDRQFAGTPATQMPGEQIYMQAAAQGITMVAAAGDAGSSDSVTCSSGTSNADYPSSSPYVLSANGTTLTISDTSGTYASETAWSCNGGSVCTGGGDSAIFAQPTWQTGPGVPSSGNRMNSDMAMHAGGRALLYYLGDAWRVAVGTSFVAPEFAGLFAVADSLNGERVGQGNKLIYDDVNAGNYVSDFHDVTIGDNGAHQAKVNWDYPTGWGSLKATSLLSHIGIQGPKGTLAGTVTAAASGSVIAGAVIDAVDNDTGKKYGVTTQSDGTYSRLLPVGSFTVTVTAYGYKKSTADVTISDGNTITKDFALNVAPTVKVHGRVSDGSGHGYGLYAGISVSTEDNGKVAEVWTDPATGKYSVELPEDATYTLKVAAAFDGYKTAEATVDLAGSGVTRNFSLAVIQACTAPGYVFSTGGFSEDFNGGTFPPAGWTVTNPVSGNVVWMLASQLPADTGNYTGGTGDAASADSNALNGGDTDEGPYDTALVSPPIPVTSLHGATVLKYKANYQAAGGDAFDLDISTDGGTTWTNVLHWTTDHGSVLATPGVDVQQNLAGYLPTSGTFRLRWRFYNANGGWNGYAQVDDVIIGGCTPVPGGLVGGVVTNAQTGEGIVGATVIDDPGDATQTLVNPADPNLAAGTYEFFVPAGDRTLTVTKGNYVPATAQVTVTNNSVVEKDFALSGATFTANPDSITMNIMVGNTATASFALSNTGDAAGVFKVLAVDAAPPATGAHALQVRLMPVAHPNWIDKSIFWIRAHARPGELLSPYATRAINQNGVIPHDSPWVNLANYPIKIGDNAAAYDSQTGKVYSISGVNNDKTGMDSAYVYDSNADTWTAIAPPPTGREAPVAKFIAGKLYLAGGVVAGGGVAEVDIYDPASDSWTSTGAPMPTPVYGAAATVLNNKIYVIGGNIPAGTSGTPTADVQIYDPASNSWSAGTAYPTAVNFEACGTIAGKIYCAGGAGSAGTFSAGYVYDPASDHWWPIADIPVSGGVLGPLYTAANGELLLAGGFVGNGLAYTNQVEAYDPITDSWASLPSTNNPVARAGGTCGADGFYNVGAIDFSSGGFAFTDEAQRLPGYACSGGKIPWLTVAPTTGTLAQGASARIMLSFDGSEQAKFTTSQVYLKINGGLGSAPIVPLTVHWLPQPVDLDVSGSVSPTGAVHKDDNLAYSITVQNLPDAGGSGTRVQLTYEIPQGVNYLKSDGAACAPPSGSVPMPATGGTQAVGVTGVPIAASVAGPASVVCDLGTIDPNKGKLVTINVRATAAASSIGATFKASAREPDSNSGNNTLVLNTNPDVGSPGPSGPAGPQGPKGEKGSGSFGWLILAGLLGLVFVAGYARRHRWI